MSFNFKTAVLVSALWHAACFGGVELTLGRSFAEAKWGSTGIAFLGPILQRARDYPQSRQAVKQSAADKLLARNLSEMLGLAASEGQNLIFGEVAWDKPSLIFFAEGKSAYFELAPTLHLEPADSSVMFYPPLPYHFLLYFKDRQVIHMEVAFYVCSEGKIIDLKRGASTGNPEVDLLIMRNLFHFLNLYKTEFMPESWQRVKIDLSH